MKSKRENQLKFQHINSTARQRTVHSQRSSCCLVRCRTSP